MRAIKTLIPALLLSSISVPAYAAPLIFTGQDDGATPGGVFSASRAAENAFRNAAAGFGTIIMEDFESYDTGHYYMIESKGLTIYPLAQDLGAAFSGIANSVAGGAPDADPARYGFNTTSGGANWLGFPGYFDSEAHFLFDVPTNSFGFFTTGAEMALTASITVTLFDGSALSYALPMNDAGGVSFFGLIDPTGFSQIAIRQTNVGGTADAWGVDDISWTSAANPAAVPEPGTWALFIAGFGLTGFAVRRRRVVTVR
ncbi:MAG: PEPxxWA-CTERM sorting domain-containing protein [Sphingomonadaceae bacterium]